MKFATFIAFLSVVAMAQGCGTQPPAVEAETMTPATGAAAQGSQTQAPSAATASQQPDNADNAPVQNSARSSEGSKLAESAARLPDAPVTPVVKNPAPATSEDKGGITRNLVGSCRLYFSDDSVRCREIYGSSQARFIEIFIKHCQAGAGDYDGQWSQSSCPLDLADKERVGGCLSEDPDYSTIAYSYIDPNDALAKGLVPLVRTQCLGTYIPER